MPSSAAAKKSSGQKKVGGKPGAKKGPGNQKLKGKGGVKASKKSQLRFAIDCSHPVEDGIMNCGDFETYLKDRIKVAGKTQNFGKDVAGALLQAVPQVPHQEVPQEEQPEGLAARRRL